MTQISTSSRAVTHFAEAYVAAAREQQGSQPIPSRLPTENEVNAMISTGLHVLQKLEEVRDIVQQNRISMERARENGGGPVARKPLEEEDVPMYGDNIKQPYNITEVKKRRGVSCDMRQPWQTLTRNSVRLLPDGVTVATGSTRPNGGVARTAHEHSATHAVFTTQSSSAGAN